MDFLSISLSFPRNRPAAFFPRRVTRGNVRLCPQMVALKEEGTVDSISIADMYVCVETTVHDSAADMFAGQMIKINLCLLSPEWKTMKTT
jgi:hypothetical protein